MHSAVPSFMGSSTSKVTKAGSTISDTIVSVVVVQTTSYGSAPGQGGTGRVAATVCTMA